MLGRLCYKKKHQPKHNLLLALFLNETSRVKQRGLVLLHNYVRGIEIPT